MSEMVERVAQSALASIDNRQVFVDGDLSKVNVDGFIDFIALARAAIEAMREPTPKMLKDGMTSDLIASWGYVIDDALKP